MPPAIDWDVVFLPSALALVRGDALTIYNPPYTLFPLLPFALLDYDAGRALMLVLALGAMVLAAYRVGATRLGALAFAISPFAFNGLAWGNVEWLALLGVCADPRVGIPLMLIKPQVTLGAVVFISAEMLGRLSDRRREAARRLVQTAIIGAALVALSFLADANWLTRALSYSQYRESVMNFSLFPYSIPCGLGLLVAALRTHRIALAIAASPCFFAVTTPQCWMVALLALATVPLEAVVVCAGFWGLTARQ